MLSLNLMHKSKNLYLYHIFVSPGDAPAIITQYVAWMERQVKDKTESSRWNSATPFGTEKLEWLGYHMVKKFRRYLYSFWRNSRTWRTDRQTDRQTDTG